ncbi:TPA: hypothetical protein MHW13_10485 [Klebsiella pneumoniae]|uniref:hypothetical protein n=1 Tax=Klebsiella pneumoniae TaxID=573 RepID=UPI000B6A2992|nr:hypothetical protein BLK97_32100 [Klebsiella pneumoniae]HBQ2198571.1 hypothetical protein [Klebsiella pneumoniae]HBQ5976300.1 hypothetical protein [Klebsiella pneumoniae subsp. pneumoniae]HBX3202629.1 hypothetical protein [Klebsiella pneumoniae]HCD6483846.1 hypothetical protein [Klebsiella pneumoniae]
MTDITELAQRNELLIANGQQTADLLRHLADNEIDSDYFAVVSECESYGKETDAELSITEFALRAAGYVDALVEALEKAQRANAAQDDHINQQQDRIDQLEKGHQEAAKQINSWRRMAKQNIAEREKDIAELDAARQRIAELESRTVTVENLQESAYRAGLTAGWNLGLANNNDGFNKCLAAHAAGIKVEAE